MSLLKYQFTHKQVHHFALPIIIGMIGILALVGWFLPETHIQIITDQLKLSGFDMDILTRYKSDHVTMKPYTALLAVFSALTIATKGLPSRLFALNILGVLFKLMYDFGEVLITGSPTPTDQVETVIHNFPSWFTIIMFSLMFYCTQCSSCAFRGGVIILILSTLAVVGHTIDNSSLYYYYTWSTGMALPTSIVGLHLGVWMIMSSDDSERAFLLRLKEQFGKDLLANFRSDKSNLYA